MDWLDELLEQLKTRINNYSLRKALAVYLLIYVAVVAILTVITQTVCDNWDYYIWSQYSRPAVDGTALVSVYYNDYYILTRLDRVVVEVIDFVQTWSTIIYSFAGILVLSYVFYNKKLREPLFILKEATVKVGMNDLDIDLHYDYKDEMGDLCRSFDLMRKQLVENNRRMWDIMEEQKRLNAAFAHDLRTPLTVLKGYTDFLNRYIPEDKISREKLLSTLSLMSEQIIRLENYSNTMKEINSLEELPIRKQPVTPAMLEQKLRDLVIVLDDENGIRIRLCSTISDQSTVLSLDDNIVMEVLENLMSNALRFARKEVEVSLSLSEDGKRLLLGVADDGKGFTRNDLIMATKPYYTEHKEPGAQHFGIGLYICRILCEKHQGYIRLENRINGGAFVTAAFLIESVKNKKAGKIQGCR